MLWVALLTCQAAVATPASSPPFAEGVRAYRAGDYRAALASFLVARAQQPDNAAVLFNLGLSYYQLTDFGNARKTFIALRQHPEMAAVAEYHLGLVAAKVGHPDRAAAHLRAAAAGGSATLRHLAQTALQLLSDRPVAQVPAAYAMAMLGIDDNRNRLDKAIEIPGQDTQATYSEALVSLQYPLSCFDDVDLRGSLFQRDYLSDDALDQRSMFLSLRKSWRAKPWVLTLATESEAITLQESGHVSSYGLDILAVQRMGSTSFRLHYEPAKVAADPAYEYLAGWRHRADISQEFQFGGVQLRAGYELETNEQSGHGIGEVQFGQPKLRKGPVLRLSRAFTPRLTIDLNAAYRDSHYHNAEQPQFQTRHRDDTMWYFSSTLRLRLGETWGLRMDYRFSDNRSNLNVFDYERNMLQLGFDWRY